MRTGLHLSVASNRSRRFRRCRGPSRTTEQRQIAPCSPLKWKNENCKIFRKIFQGSCKSSGFKESSFLPCLSSCSTESTKRFYCMKKSFCCFSVFLNSLKKHSSFVFYCVLCSNIPSNPSLFSGHE